MVKRFMAHEIVYDGISHKLHIAELDTATGKITLHPYKGETHSTTFINGTVVLLPCRH